MFPRSLTSGWEHWLDQEIRLGGCPGVGELRVTGPSNPRGRCPLMSGTAWAVCGMSRPWSQGGEALCTCPICILGSDLAAAEDRAGGGCGETSGLCFEPEPGLDAGIDSRPRSSPCWPQINGSCHRASELPPAPPGSC